MSISVLILTFNEEFNLAACLDSVNWSDDIVVVDSFSSDGTIKVAESGGARVLQRRFDDFARQRNYGLETADFRHKWVLHLDADERVTAESRQEMFNAVQSGSRDAFRIASKMMFRGKWLKHASLYPWYQVRLGHRDRLRFKQVGHGQRETMEPARIGTLRQPLLHYSFSKGLEDWVEKHNRYSTAEALHAVQGDGDSVNVGSMLTRDPSVRKRALKLFFARLPFRPALRFLYMYFWRRGFIDGASGFTYCRLLAMYEYLIVQKTKEERLRKTGRLL